MELADWLVDVTSRRGVPKRSLREATAMLEALRSGISPNPRAVRRLREQLRPPSLCARLESDGTCRWLRRYGAAERLPVPPVGEPALCIFIDRYAACPGYKKPGKEDPR